MVQINNLIENILRRVINLWESISGKKVSEQKIHIIFQFLKFGLVGISNSVINYFVYVISLNGMHTLEIFIENDYIMAQLLAFLLSVLWAFYWNSKYVFNGADHSPRELLLALAKTYISYGITGLVLSELLLILWVEILGVSAYIAPIINIIICLPLNFILNKIWAFNKK